MGKYRFRHYTTHTPKTGKEEDAEIPSEGLNVRRRQELPTLQGSQFVYNEWSDINTIFEVFLMTLLVPQEDLGTETCMPAWCLDS